MPDPGHDWWDDDEYLLGLVAEVFRAESPPGGFLQVAGGRDAGSGRGGVDGSPGPPATCPELWTPLVVPD